MLARIIEGAIQRGIVVRGGYSRRILPVRRVRHRRIATRLAFFGKGKVLA